LAFEESGDFPANRSELYKEGLDALLKKWDAKRGIYRDLVYKKLSSQRKEDLLSKIALTTFKEGDYFFKQRAVEQYITEYICNLPDANTNPEALQLDSEVVLRSIEAQHGLLVERAKGIYSFSHLTFHEYFTAREIVVGKQSSEEALQNLVNYITDYRWQEVFLLAVGMSSNADPLLQLMKQQVDAILADDEKLQQFLMWASEKSRSVEVPYKPAVIRTIYFCFVLARAIQPHLLNAYEIDLACVIESPSYSSYWLKDRLKRIFKHEFSLVRNLDLTCNLAKKLVYARSRAGLLADKLKDYLNKAITSARSEFKQSLKYYRGQLPDADCNQEIFKQWWKSNGYTWAEEVRALTIKHCNHCQDWQFSGSQKRLLRQYYNANVFLLECLNSDCYVSREVRQEIEDTLLLPIAEIENRKHR
jgi:predicted NACHT family NTPase